MSYGFARVFCLFVALVVLFPGAAAAWGPPNYVTQWGGLGNPHGIAVNGSGYVYIADTNYDQVRVFDPSGAPVTQWGSAGYNPGEFDQPYGIAVNGSGYVYVADTVNNRVQVFDPSGTPVRQWGDYGSGSGYFMGLYSIAVNASGYVYTVENANNRVQVFDPSGKYMTQWGSLGTGNGQFGYPFGIAVDASGFVYVTDVTNYRVQVFDPSGTYVTKWGSPGTGNGQFTRPNGIAASADGYVYVTDFDGTFPTIDRVQVFDLSGAYVTKWGYYGWSDPGQFQYPRGVAVNGSGYAYVADTANNRVQVFTPLTTMITAVDAITGTPEVGRTLTAGTVLPAGATVTYQWVESSTESGTYAFIPGATGTTYEPVAGDLGKYIEVYATGTGMYSVRLNSTAAGPVTAPLTGIGAISGTPEVGQTLTAGALTPAGATVTYQWNESASAGGPWTPVAGATGTTYVPVAGDIGRYLAVNVTGTGSYTGFASSAATGPVTAPLNGIGAITGRPEVGSTLTAGAVTPAGATAAFQWHESASASGPWTQIPGATGTTYVPVAGDVGMYLMVNATGTGSYTGFAGSTPVGPVTGATPTTTPTTVPTTPPTTVPTTVPVTTMTTAPASVPAYSSGQSGETLSDFPSSDLPIMTVTVNIGGDSKAWQAVVTGTGLRDLIVTGTVQPGSGSNMTAPPGTVYQYISLVPARYTSITKAVIHFAIAQSWLDESHITPGSIVLYHQTANGGWEALPTTILYTKDGSVYFSAESTGFSLFAIAGTPAAATPAVTTADTFGSIVQEQVTTRAIATKAPVTTQTTAPPAATPQPAAPSPLLNIVLVIAAIGILATGGFMVHHWGIRRQNPALFRESD